MSWGGLESPSTIAGTRELPALRELCSPSPLCPDSGRKALSLSWGAWPSAVAGGLAAIAVLSRW